MRQILESGLFHPMEPAELNKENFKVLPIAEELPKHLKI